MPIPKTRIMYIERGGGLSFPGRIGRVRFSKTGRTVYYGERRLRSLNGRGYKTTHFDEETGEEYWVSGPRRDGNDPLYPGVVEIDKDAREEYWLQIREAPDQVHLTSFRCPGKYSRRKPRPELAVHGPSRKGSNERGSVARRSR